MMTKPSRPPTAIAATTITVAPTRQGLSTSFRSGGAPAGVSRSGGTAMSAQLVHKRLRGRIDEELGDGISVGEQHQQRDQDVPEPEAVERCWHARGGMNG